MSNVPDELLKQIDEYLAIRKKSKGSGWPEVTPEEIFEISRITELLLETKYERDVDGDLPVDWTFVDRTRYYHPFLDYAEMTYPSKLKTLREYHISLRQAILNLSIATREVDQLNGYIETLLRDKKEVQELVINER